MTDGTNGTVRTVSRPACPETRPREQVESWHVAFVIDAFSRRTMDRRAATSTRTALDARGQAIQTRHRTGITGFGQPPPHHDDARSRHTSIRTSTTALDQRQHRRLHPAAMSSQQSRPSLGQERQRPAKATAQARSFRHDRKVGHLMIASSPCRTRTRMSQRFSAH